MPLHAVCEIRAVFIAGLFMLIPTILLGLFSSDPKVLAYGSPLLVVGAFYQFFDAIAIISDGALRGAGDTRWPFVARCLVSWLVFLPLAYLFAIPIGWGSRALGLAAWFRWCC